MSFTSSLDHPRDFRVAVTARALSLFGDLVTLTTLALLVQSRGEPAWVLAALFSAGLLPVVLLAPITGRLVDSTDSRVLLVVAGTLATAASAVLALAPSTPWLLVLAGCVGATSGVLASTWSALVPAIVGPSRVAAAAGISQTASATAMLLAPAAAEVLAGWVGYHVPLLLDAATFAGIALAGLTIGTRRRPRPTGRPVRAREGWSVLRRDPVLRAAVVLLAAFVLLANCINVTDIYLIRHDLGLGPAWYGLFGALWGLGAVAGGAIAARRPGESSQSVLLVSGCVLVCTAATALALAGGAGALVPIALVGGLGNGWSNAGANALFMMRSPDAVRGRVSAAIGALLSGSQLGAYALGALLVSALTPRAVLALIGVAGVLLALLFGRTLLGITRPQRSVDTSPQHTSAALIRVGAGM